MNSSAALVPCNARSSIANLLTSWLYEQCKQRRVRRSVGSRSVAFNWITVLISIGLLPAILPAGNGLAADQITISYGLLERSISVEALEEYAADGSASKDLRGYLQYLNDEQQAQLRQVLMARADLGVVPVSQFLYSDQGEGLLRQLGEVVRTESNLSGFYAIRSALILAADAPEGLTILNVLKEFPLSNIRVDLGRTLQIWSNLQNLIQQTQEAATLVSQQSQLEAEAQAEAIPSSTALPDLERLGPDRWQMKSIQLTDPSRNRTFPADLYLPQATPQSPAPVIVISHGLGSDRTTYAYLAKQLASYGFAVAVPEHPGSNAQQLQALIAGTASQVTPPSEFVDRPLDIKYLLNVLDRLNQSDPELVGRFNLNQVGVVGQSFGGYTALALAGAKINLQQLATDCNQKDALNLSLLLQCRALELPQPLPNLKDDRVKAILAINPIGSSLIGAQDFAEVQVPVMLVSGSADTIAPALLEQIRPFTWLKTPDKYFVLLQGGTHFSTIDVPAESKATSIQLPTEIVGPDPALARTYLKALGVAFFEAHLARNTSYFSYLDANYAQRISKGMLPLSFVRLLTSTQLTQVIQEPPASESTNSTSQP